MKKICLLLSVVLILALSIITSYTMIAAEKADAVFISDSGSDANSGTSAAAPVKSMVRAYELVNDGGSIVICGKTSLNSESTARLPVSDKRVTLTSVYGGVDYKSNGACIALSTHMYIGSDMTIENLFISQSSSPMIFCQGNNVKFGEGITCNTSSTAPAIYGGTNLDNRVCKQDHLTSQYFDFEIEICSGVWYTVNGGFYRNAEGDKTGVVGDVRIVINGGRFTAPDTKQAHQDILYTNAVCGAGAAALLGDLHLEINGGEFSQSVYGLGIPGMNSTKRLCAYIGNVYIDIRGGTFRGRYLSAVEESTYSIDGNYYLNVSGGTFSSLTDVSATGVIGTAYHSVPESMEGKLRDFSKNVFVSSDGNDTASGTASSPLRTLSYAFYKLKDTGGRIILCDEQSIGGALPKASREITVTSSHNGHSFKNTAALKLESDTVIGGNTIIEELTIKASEPVSINANGHDLRIGRVKETNSILKAGMSDVLTKGTIDLLGGESKGTAHKLTVLSGSFRNVKGGTSDVGSAVIIGGGKITGDVYGSSDKKSVGNATVRIDGGEVLGKIYATEYGSDGAAGVSILGGKVSSSIISAAKSGSVQRFSVGIYGGTVASSTVITKDRAKEAYAHSADKYASRLSKFSKENDVYVSDGGSGDGSSPLDPVGDLYTAISMIGSGGGRVVCVSETSAYKVVVLGSKGKLTLSTFGGGCDFALTDSSRLTFKAGFELSSDTILDELNMFFSENDTFIACNGNSLLVTDSVNMASSPLRKIERELSVYGGARVGGAGNTGTKPVSIELQGGVYYKVYGGNIRKNSADSSIHKINGNIDIVIGNGVFTGGVYLNGENDLSGNATLTVYDGIFNCPVLGMTSAYSAHTDRKLKVDGNVTVNIHGGEYRAELDAYKDGSVIFNGKYTLNVYSAELDRACSVKGTQGLEGNNSSMLNLSDKIDTGKKVSGTIDFTNPIGGYPDPSVILGNDGYYYYAYTDYADGKPAIFIKRALNLCDITYAEPRLVWKVTAGMPGSAIESVWAPQLYFFDGVWYMYATCANSTNISANRKPYVWVGGEQPSDDFEFFGIMEGVETQRFYASPRFVDWNGIRYLVCGSIVNGSYSLIVTKTESPTKLVGAPTVIARYTMGFEAKILEGPVPIISPNGTLYVTYAAGHTRLEEYCTGLLRFTGSKTDSLLDSSKWHKYSEPFHFASPENGVYSPGAMVFVKSPDGAQTWCVFTQSCIPTPDLRSEDFSFSR